MAEESRKQWKAVDLPVILPEEVPEFFVDGYRGAVQSSGVVRINFVQYRMSNNQSQMEQQVAVRLIMPVSVLVAVNEALTALIAVYEKDGTIKKEPPSGQEGSDGDSE